MQITRRSVLSGVTAAAPMTFTGRTLAGWEPSERYPDPAIQVPTLTSRNIGLHSQASSGSSPACAGARDRSILATRAACYGAISPTIASCVGTRNLAAPASTVRRRISPTATRATARDGWSPASTIARRITRTEYDGTITVLMDKFEGKPLNSPNDIVVKSDDSIWFSDPPFGILGNYEGHVATPELPTNVYRLDKTGRATVVAGDINRPNGLCFNPDEKKMYIVEAGVTPRVIRAYDVAEDGRLLNGRPFITAEAGGNSGRLSLRRRWQSLVRVGHGQCCAGWREDFRPERQADRLYRSAGTLRKPLLRRQQA